MRWWNTKQCCIVFSTKGGGIGVTPMIAFAHHLHALGRDFEFHYSASRKGEAGYLDDLPKMPWADKIQYHFSDQGARADLDAVLANYQMGWHVYTCGPDRFMNGVMDAAERQGFPEDARHLEYFSVPDQPDYVNHDFTVKLAKSGKQLTVPADKDLSDVLIENGIHVDVKCADGICGVCKCGLVDGDVEHLDCVCTKTNKRPQLSPVSLVPLTKTG
jgi:ferredoxin